MENIVYETVISNCKKVGGKNYACVPIEALIVDHSFQRIDSMDKGKVNKLVEHWDPIQMDALKVVPHPEEACFSVVDGCHRLGAARINGLANLECEIIPGAPTDPEERRKFEAKIFLEQFTNVERLKPAQMHKARLLIGDKVAIIVEKLLKEYDVKIIWTKGRRKERYLGSYTGAYRVAKVYGEEGLRFIFEVCKNAGYDFEQDGYNACVLRCLNKIYVAYGKQAIVVCDFMRQLNPYNFKAKAIAKYPQRSPEIAMALILQDYLIDVHSMTRRIDEEGKVMLLFRG